MRFAFIPLNRYDAPTSRGLCNALTELGHQALILPPHKLWLPNLRIFHRNPDALKGFDVVVEVNAARDDTVPKDTVHIAWIQDYGKGDPQRCYDRIPLGNSVYRSANGPPLGSLDHYDAGDPLYENALDHDLIYTFGDPDVLGCPRFKQWRGSLTMAITPNLLSRPAVEPSIDFSIAGFMPPAEWFSLSTAVPASLEGHFNIRAEICDMIINKTTFQPLSGKFDQLAEFAQFRTNFQQLLTRHHWGVEEGGLCEMCKYGAKTTHEYARFLNRQAIAKLILSVSQDVEFWGFNWADSPQLKPFAKPFSDTADLLLNLYQRSRINVHDNIYGFALHSRVLEAMAVGGFIMANESPHIGKAGQMTETFEPDVHYGEYGPQSFVERARYWLRSPELRKKAVDEARKVIRDKHLWKNRAQQILWDLGLGKV